MMIENNYSINVTKMEIKADYVPRYYHYCQIELGNMLPDEANEKFREICNLFPRWEFVLTLNYIECSSKTIAERQKGDKYYGSRMELGREHGADRRS